MTATVAMARAGAVEGHRSQGRTVRQNSMEFLSDLHVWIAFAMLTALEIVLGIDNIIFIFISILVGRLPAEMRDKARRIGLGFAMVSRFST